MSGHIDDNARAEHASGDGVEDMAQQSETIEDGYVSQIETGLTIEAVEAVEPPNSVPTNGRFETSSDNYSAGFAEMEPPEWLQAESKRLSAERESTPA